MEKPLCVALCTAAALALLACNTTGSRVRQHQEAFDARPPHVQHNLRNGVIEVEYAPEMLFIPLGAPAPIPRSCRPPRCR